MIEPGAPLSSVSSPASVCSESSQDHEDLDSVTIVASRYPHRKRGRIDDFGAAHGQFACVPQISLKDAAAAAAARAAAAAAADDDDEAAHHLRALKRMREDPRPFAAADADSQLDRQQDKAVPVEPPSPHKAPAHPDAMHMDIHDASSASGSASDSGDENAPILRRRRFSKPGGARPVLKPILSTSSSSSAASSLSSADSDGPDAKPDAAADTADAVSDASSDSGDSLPSPGAAKQPAAAAVAVATAIAAAADAQDSAAARSPKKTDASAATARPADPSAPNKPPPKKRGRKPKNAKPDPNEPVPPYKVDHFDLNWRTTKSTKSKPDRDHDAADAAAQNPHKQTSLRPRGVPEDPHLVPVPNAAVTAAAARPLYPHHYPVMAAGSPPMSSAAAPVFAGMPLPGYPPQPGYLPPGSSPMAFRNPAAAAAGSLPQPKPMGYPWGPSDAAMQGHHHLHHHHHNPAAGPPPSSGHPHPPSGALPAQIPGRPVEYGGHAAFSYPPPSYPPNGAAQYPYPAPGAAGHTPTSSAAAWPSSYAYPPADPSYPAGYPPIVGKLGRSSTVTAVAADPRWPAASDPRYAQPATAFSSSYPPRELPLVSDLQRRIDGSAKPLPQEPAPVDWQASGRGSVEPSISYPGAHRLPPPPPTPSQQQQQQQQQQQEGASAPADRESIPAHPDRDGLLRRHRSQEIRPLTLATGTVSLERSQSSASPVNKPRSSISLDAGAEDARGIQHDAVVVVEKPHHHHQHHQQQHQQQQQMMMQPRAVDGRASPSKETAEDDKMPASGKDRASSQPQTQPQTQPQPTTPSPPPLVQSSVALADPYVRSILNVGSPKRMSAALWQDAAPILSKMLSHPFTTALIDGSLDESVFLFFLIQQSILLRDLAKALSIVASRTSTPGAMTRILRLTQADVDRGDGIYEQYLKQFKLKRETVLRAHPAPDCLLYTSYLFRVAHEHPLAESLCAFLAAHWVQFNYVRYIVALRAARTPKIATDKIRAWLELSCSSSTAAGIEGLIAIVDDLADAAPAEDPRPRAEMRRLFLQCCKMEYMFVDLGFKEQRWVL